MARTEANGTETGDCHQAMGMEKAKAGGSLDLMLTSWCLEKGLTEMVDPRGCRMLDSSRV